MECYLRNRSGIRRHAIPQWCFMKVSILAVFTTRAEVQYNSKISNHCKVIFLTLGWYQPPRSHFEYLIELLYWSLAYSILKFHPLPVIFFSIQSVQYFFFQPFAAVGWSDK